MLAVLDYGIGNLRSAQKALEHLGAHAQLATTIEETVGAHGVVLPGVGNFGACAAALRQSGLDAAVYEAIEREIPFLGICVGFQLLFEGSIESPHVAGLGVLEGQVTELSREMKLPQMQWNALDRTGRPSLMLEGLAEVPWCYFVHSYAPDPRDPERAGVVATCQYGGVVTAAIERGAVWATQFHPEKSGPTGLGVLANFVRFAEEHAASNGARLGPPGERAGTA